MWIVHVPNEQEGKGKEDGLSMIDTAGIRGRSNVNHPHLPACG
jgi:hypothetical protein